MQMWRGSADNAYLRMLASNGKKTGGRKKKKKILDEYSDSTAEKQTISPLRDYNHALRRVVKPLIITMTTQ